MEILKKYENFEPDKEWLEFQLPPEFENFLISKNSLDQFIDNFFSYGGIKFRKKYDFPIDIELFFKNVRKESWIDYSFVYKDTPEGYKYWEELSILWVYSSDINESFEPEEEWEEEDDAYTLMKGTLLKDFPFKKGDRVHVYRNDKKDKKIDNIGKIVSISNVNGHIDSVNMCFDENIGGHTMHHQCIDGHGWVLSSFPIEFKRSY